MAAFAQCVNPSRFIAASLRYAVLRVLVCSPDDLAQEHNLANISFGAVYQSMRAYIRSQIPIRLFSLFSANIGTLGAYLCVAVSVLYIKPLDPTITRDEATYRIKSLMTEVDSFTRLLVMIPAFISMCFCVCICVCVFS